MADQQRADKDQMEQQEGEERVGRNRHGTMDTGQKGGTKGSNFENSGPNETGDAVRESAHEAGGPANPHLSADQDTSTGRM